jgi:DNA-binding LacI/PurR family transcriptional regulator
VTGGGAIGLVLARPARMLGGEAFFMELIAGIEEVLSPQGLSVLLHVVPDHAAEIAAWRRWEADGLVDALIVVDQVVDDPRTAVLADLRLPAVAVGGPAEGMAVPSVSVDDADGARQAADLLAGLGHRRIARISGPSRLLHTRARSDELARAGAERGLSVALYEGDYTEAAGRELTIRALAADPRPTAILYDNDVMAAAALAVAADRGLLVPEQLSLVAWDDSPLCRMATPALTAVAVDVHALGTLVGQAVLDALAGRGPHVRAAAPPRLVVRGSTAAPALIPTPKVTR